jgi:hypothetical protein
MNEKMICNSCNLTLSDSSRFCPECGTPVSQIKVCGHCGAETSPSHKFCESCGSAVLLEKSGVANERVADRDSATGDEVFAFLLSEEKLRTVKESASNVPYGCLAIVCVDNVITHVQTQARGAPENPGLIEGFFTRLMDSARSLVGQQKREVKTWVVNDYRRLPIVTYSHPLIMADAPEAQLRFEFWLDAGDELNDAQRNASGVFIQRVLFGKQQLTIQEFRQAAVRGVQTALQQVSVESFALQEQCDAVIELLQRTTGIGGRCFLVKGKNSARRYFEVSKIRKPVCCRNCEFVYGLEQSTPLQYCEHCGASMSGVDWLGMTAQLQSADGQSLVLRLSALAEADVLIDEAALQAGVINALRSRLSSTSLESLAEGAALNGLASILNIEIPRQFGGRITDFVVLDVRTSERDWIFKTDALVAEELQRIATQHRLLDVNERTLEYRDAEFALKLREIHQDNAEAISRRRAALEVSTKQAALSIEEHRLRLSTSLDVERLNADDERQRDELQQQVDQRRFDIERDKITRERAFRRDLSGEDRADEVARASHEMLLESRVAQHDADLSDLVDSAQSRSKRREVDDRVYATEEDLRLKLKEKEQLGRLEEDFADRQSQRQVDKLRAMAELESKMSLQEQNFQLAKAQQLQGLDAAQILAMQAAELVKAAGSEASAEIVRSIAQSQADAKNQADRDQLFAQMLEVKDKASGLAIEAQRSAMESVLKMSADVARVATDAGANSKEGYKEAARIAQETNEKSMDAMQKVAVAAAAGVAATTRKESKRDKDSFACNSCGKSHDERKKFCPHCGSAQSPSEP